MFGVGSLDLFAQQTPPKPAGEPSGQHAEKTDRSEKAANPAQIELLETKVRFETNGDSRREVHALVKIHSELGVRQFAQLNFDFNRSFESIDIPLVRITHANGGTADILPSAITDRPNPVVVNAPGYQDVRVKSVRMLGLQPGDTLEYRVIRTVSHHPCRTGKFKSILRLLPMHLPPAKAKRPNELFTAGPGSRHPGLNLAKRQPNRRRTFL